MVISPARRFQKTKIQLPTLNPDRVPSVSCQEVSFYNLVTGESGAEPDFPHELYCQRIDNSVSNIKKQFTRLNIAIQHIERDLRQPAAANPPPHSATPDRRYATRKALSAQLPASWRGSPTPLRRWRERRGRK